MKNNILKYSVIAGFFLFLLACSTKRNSFISRNSHALSTEYNILYNGGIALETGIAELKTNYKDNFWERLPIERMQISQEAFLPGQTKNANFDRAETKAIKAIQKHSMNIAGAEKNPQMDEAHLMLGKARYYDQRFVPALEAFNYILYKYPNSDKIYEAKVWREKTNIRMENDALAVNNLRRLLKEIKFKDQIFADANAILSQAFLNLEEKDSAIAKLKLATEFTKQKEEKARYRFILGQIYDELGYKDSAFAAYQSVIDMKRKSPRQYVIQAHARQAQQFDFEEGDSIAFLKKFNKLLRDRENRPYLDVLNHQLALFYDKSKKYDIAQNYYNKSLKARSQDSYLAASNYRNLADVYFNKARYQMAGQYYDSTLTQLNTRSREYKAIKKKRENLVDVIKYESIATRNDSILYAVSLSDAERISYYDKHIVNLKKADQTKKAQQEKASKSVQQNGGKSEDLNPTGVKDGAVPQANQPMLPPVNVAGSQESNFYFYNPATVAFGKNEFRKRWGNRAYKNNWRLSTTTGEIKTDAIAGIENENTDGIVKNVVEEKYSSAFYIKQLPVNENVIDSIAKERNFAYFQLGVIYKEKFKEYPLAAAKFEQLLKNNPEERLVLPSLYNLSKIYEMIDKDKAAIIKNRIISQYPESRYAQILNSPGAETTLINESPEVTYNKLYKLFEAGDYRTVLSDLEIAINQFTGEEMVPKFELLKATTAGKLKGVEEYRKAINFVALNYPYSDEGKQSELLLGKDIPALESLRLYAENPKTWKLLYRFAYPDAKNIKIVQDKINKFVAARPYDKLSSSVDIYNMTDNFIVIHGIISEAYAKGILTILKEYKDYKIAQTPVVISNYNYKVVQIKKNLEEYLTTPPSIPIPAASPSETPITPIDIPSGNNNPPGNPPVNNAVGNPPGQPMQNPNKPPVFQEEKSSEKPIIQPKKP
ncbi:tetratricopeptide repeat protein [Flavobacterium sp. GT3R68]|uniref:type IX secretion system periplasmic lipoprotein PorW/SprE n=1 Tax=Flavobacterium sp. GT3R68 TaxID=2594437 RepID=UPI000F86C7D8|nr:tetratricopeptide repeat protein [Flavobacterium sp. GT3R68]RTY95936.1 tetratricopeptide repeat protein [Flavobacterium sp. GSN2]TRW93708.1 tetratricopeptide repeat protein [Flavobacterium sp. GT3R68]